MKTNILKPPSLLSLTITALLTLGMLGYAQMSYSGDDDDDHHRESTTNDSDSDYRGTSRETKNITICHIPPGNPANKHTIHIGYSAWPAHRDNHGGDYLGSCTKATPTGTTDPTTTTTDGTTTGGTTTTTTSSTVDQVHIINGCTGEARATLINLVQTYFDPVVVNDDALKDDHGSVDIVTALSQCLDAGDSSDSGDGNKNNRGHGKGNGYDSVSDSGNHHFIRACKSKSSNRGDSNDSNDSNDFRGNLKSKGDNHNRSNHHGDSSVIVSDSSLDDSGVKRVYASCIAKDSVSIKTGLGDSGHKYRIVKGCNDSDLKKELDAHKTRTEDLTDAKYKDLPITLTTRSLEDVAIKAAYDNCIAQNIPDNPVIVTTPPSNNNPNAPGTGLTNQLPSAKERGRLNWRETTK
jgi:hypothetical protein